jgi:ABC transporter, phosphonate, periplasmic substrate-binding protein
MADTGIQARSLEVRDYGLRQCDFSGEGSAPVLHILDAVYMEEVPLLEVFCQSSRLARDFSSIELRSVHRDRLDLRELYESRYDVILAKPELMGDGAEGSNARVDYVLVAQYPDYGSQLVALKGKPELSAQWLRGKKLGLLDDPNSVSAYQIPLRALRNRGLEDEPDIIYFRSYRQLYRALFSGEVDVIPALLSNEGPASRLQLPEGLVLEEIISGPGWYISSRLVSTPSHCGVMAALEKISADAPVDFFRQLRVLAPCDES